MRYLECGSLLPHYLCRKSRLAGGGKRQQAAALQSASHKFQLASRVSASAILLKHALCFLLLLLSLPSFAAESPKNLFTNPGFELGRDGWDVGTGGKTECKFTIEEKAPSGQYCGRLTIGAVQDWGVQFGQAFTAGQKGKTYTFSVLARSLKGNARVNLQLERHGAPYDRAAEGPTYTLTEAWREIHLTFKVGDNFPEGWFAYLSCQQPEAKIEADLFRLCEGAFVPYQEIVKEEAAVAGVRLFDSGAPLAGEPDAKALAARTGWTEVAEDETAHAFKGDAVLMNDRLACVLRRGAAGAALYTLGAGGAARRAELVPTGGAEAGKLSSVAVKELSPAGGVLAATFAAAGKALTVRFELKMGQPFIQAENAGGAEGLRVEAPCRFAVLPDFFADDIVIDAADLAVDAAELPGDNFMLHLLPGGEAIVMTVRKTSDEDIRVRLAGQGAARQLTGSELRFGKENKMWVGVMSAPAIWSSVEIAKEQAGRELALDWRQPFPAQWRIDWRRAGDRLSDSWEMIAEQADGSFIKQGIFGEAETLEPSRHRWTTVLGNFSYPAWVGRDGRGHLQPLKCEELRFEEVGFEGPALIYPLGRRPATALGDFTVIDIMRNTLGVGPCEYILDVEGQQAHYKGRATCAVRETLNPIYEEGQQVARRAEIEKALDDLMAFVRHIRGRVEGYVTFAHELRAYLARQRAAHPELAAPLSKLDALAASIDKHYAERKAAIRTPDEVAETVAEFRKTVLTATGAPATEQCRKYTLAWVEVGGNQDELVGECRWAARMLRQRAALMLAAEPRLAEVAHEVRQRCQAVLRSPSGHESATH